jgi:hypothetical protein
MEVEVCWDTRLWANAPHGRCPCLSRRSPRAVTCGLRGIPIQRPVTMCRFAPMVKDFLEVQDVDRCSAVYHEG